VARAKASKNDNFVDPKVKKQFLEMRDHWKGLDDRANSAAGKRRQYQAEIKQAGFSMGQIKDSIMLSTPEGEAEFKASIANRLLAAAYSDADVGDQLSLFLDHDRTPAVDRAYREGQSAAMKNEAAVPKYDPSTDQYKAFMEGYHDEQGRQVKAGIKKLEEPKDGKKGKKAKAAPAGSGKKRGRPAGSGKKAAAAAPEGAETRLITKAEKEAKAAARAPKADSAPPRKPPAQPVTRASLAAQRQAAKDEADSYFTKAEPAGNA
jgi:hypothetical protein